MNIKRSWVFGLVLALTLVWAPSAAFATIKGRIYEGKGIKAARLGMKDSKAAKKIGGKYKREKDDSYAGQTVWVYWFAKKSGGKYPVEMYSHANHKVFTFVINTKKLKTKNGTHVGTSESTLTDRYGDKLTKEVGPVYTDYHMGSSSGRTDFWVLNGKVHHIVISRY